MIDEKKLIEDIHCYFRKKIDNEELEVIDKNILTLSKELCGIIKAQHKVDDWIPVSERLPEEEHSVQVTYLGFHDKKPYCDAAAYLCDGEWLWSLDESRVDVEVVAWKEFSTPYVPG